MRCVLAVGRRHRCQPIPAVSGRAFVGLRRDRRQIGERQIVNFRGRFPPQADWLPLDEIAGTSAVLADPRWVEGAAGAVLPARGWAFRPSSMPTWPSRSVRTLLPLTDHAVFSEPALKILRASRTMTALKSITRFDCRVAAVTRGQRRRELGRGRQLHSVPPIRSMPSTPRAPAMSSTAPMPLRSAAASRARRHVVRLGRCCAEMHPGRRPRRHSRH